MFPRGDAFDGVQLCKIVERHVCSLPFSSLCCCDSLIGISGAVSPGEDGCVHQRRWRKLEFGVGMRKTRREVDLALVRLGISVSTL